ncbi:hypothetical protein [Arthrobacter pigmenti]
MQAFAAGDHMGHLWGDVPPCSWSRLC